jgi:microcystin-dependent protein
MEQQSAPSPLRGYYDGCPVGTILVYAGEWTKDLQDLGWRLCDGFPLDVAGYPDLYNAIKNLYGGDAINFNLPDLQGYFIRGVNTKTVGKDPNRKVASKQDDDFKKHKHQWSGWRAGGSLTGNHARAENWIEADGQNDCTNEVGGAETRPVNIAMNYIIKVKYIM